VRAVVQRVTCADVSVRGETVSSIERGLLVLLGVEANDGEEDLQYIVHKTVNLRIFCDEDGKMNRSVREIGGSILLVSQFTLLGDARRGRRPSYTDAAQPEAARNMYARTAALLREEGIPISEGRFMENMQVRLCNDGPVTLLLDSRKRI